LLDGVLGGRLFKPLSAAAATPFFQDSFRRRGTSKGWGRPWFNQRRGLPWGTARKKGSYKIPSPQLGAGRHSPDPVIVLNHDLADVDVKGCLSASNPQGSLRSRRAHGRLLELLRRLSREPGSQGIVVARIALPAPRRKVLKIASRAVKSNTQYWVRLKVTGTNPGRDPVEGVGGRENRAQKVGGSVSDSDPQRRIERPGAFGFFFAHDDNSRKAARFI